MSRKPVCRRTAVSRLVGGGLAACLAAGKGPAFAASASGSAEAKMGLTFFRIGTGPTAETLYGLGTAISAGISRPPGGSPCDEGGICGVPGLIAVAQTRSGSIANLEAVRSGDIESALVHADMAYWAYHGGGSFRSSSPMRDLRVISHLSTVSLHIVVPAESDIWEITDLRDRFISLGARGSGTLGNAKLLLRSRGILLNDIHPRYQKPGPAADSMVSGKLDAFFEIGGVPVDAIADLAYRMPIRLLQIDKESIRQVMSLHPFFEYGPIPANSYRGVAETLTLKLGVTWVVRAQASPALIEAITRALWQGGSRELFLANNPNAHFPTINEAVTQIGVPFHEGARSYYKSANLM